MGEHDQYPMLRDLAESAEEITVPAVIVRELLAERDALVGERNRHGSLYVEAIKDRDRLRAVVDTLSAMGSEYKHALEHVASCGGACNDCQRLARSALAHENLADFQLDAGELLLWRRLADLDAQAVAELRVRAEAAEAERDNLQTVVDGYVDDLSHIAFAVASHQGAVHHDDILGLVQGVVAERDRLRAVVTGALLAIETVLMDDHVDMGVPAADVLGRTVAALKKALGDCLDVAEEATDGHPDVEDTDVPFNDTGEGT
jgi:bacterioferritin-associated ferredoxin